MPANQIQVSKERASLKRNRERRMKTDIEKKKKRRPPFAHRFSLVPLTPPSLLPLFQYSEKYYDDIYEYRCAFGTRRSSREG